MSSALSESNEEMLLQSGPLRRGKIGEGGLLSLLFSFFHLLIPHIFSSLLPSKLTDGIAIVEVSGATVAHCRLDGETKNCVSHVLLFLIHFLLHHQPPSSIIFPSTFLVALAGAVVVVGVVGGERGDATAKWTAAPRQNR